MQLEEYFEFEKSPERDCIRVKGTRVAIEVLLKEFIEGKSAAQIHENYPTVSLEQVYATITYYLHNQQEVDGYMKRSKEVAEAAYQEWLRTHKPSPLEQRLRDLRQASNGGKQPSS